MKQIAREKSRKKEWVNTTLYQESINVEETTTLYNCNLIDEAVALLSPRQKKVYTLSRRDGMKQQEIAMELKIYLETGLCSTVNWPRFFLNYLCAHSASLFFFLLVSSSYKKIFPFHYLFFVSLLSYSIEGSF